MIKALHSRKYRKRGCVCEVKVAEMDKEVNADCLAKCCHVRFDALDERRSCLILLHSPSMLQDKLQLRLDANRYVLVESLVYTFTTAFDVEQSTRWTDRGEIDAMTLKRESNQGWS